MESDLLCARCGALPPEGSHYCNTCGAPLPALRPDVFHPPHRLARPSGVTVLAALDIAIAVMAVGGATWMAREAEDPYVVGACAALVAGATLHAVAAYGLLRLRRWGRNLQALLGVLGLFGFPAGTLVSVLVLVYLMHPGTDLVFSGRDPETFSDDERRDIARVTRSPTFVVVAVVGVAAMALFTLLVAAVALPRFLDLRERGAQERTMAELRTIGAAVEAYAVDHDRYPVVSSIEDLRPLIEPRYMRRVPRHDAWRHPLRAVAWWNADARPPDGGYSVASPGRDGVWEEEDLRSYAGGETTSLDADIVFESGQFIQHPEGMPE